MRKLIVLLFATISLLGQDPAVARLKHEMLTARAQAQQAEQDNNSGRTARRESRRFTGYFGIWLESRLPKNLYSLAG